MDIVTDKNKVYEIARDDPIVYNLLTRVELGQINFEQAMIAGVVILSQRGEELQKLVTGLVATSVEHKVLTTMREVGQGLSPAQKKDIEKIINRAIHSDVANALPLIHTVGRTA